MAHVSPEHLSGHALGLSDELTADESAHLAGCTYCRDELGALRGVADLGRQPDTSRVPLAPPTAVWSRITAELAADEPVAVPSRTPESGPAPEPTPEPTPAVVAPAVVAPVRRSRRRIVLLAAAVGVVVGVAGTLGIARAVRPGPSIATAPPVEVLARTTLSALPGKTGSGSAELLRTSTATELRVSVHTDPVASRYQELWLINTDGERMYALGVLPPSGAASYPLPAELAEHLEGYTIVDVSIEPYDGNAAHSRNSVVRGTLP